MKLNLTEQAKRRHEYGYEPIEIELGDASFWLPRNPPFEARLAWAAAVATGAGHFDLVKQLASVDPETGEQTGEGVAIARRFFAQKPGDLEMVVLAEMVGRRFGWVDADELAKFDAEKYDRMDAAMTEFGVEAPERPAEPEGKA